MKVITVVVWSLLISFLVSYVLSSMTNTPLNLRDITILGAVLTVAILFVGRIKVETGK